MWGEVCGHNTFARREAEPELAQYLDEFWLALTHDPEYSAQQPRRWRDAQTTLSKEWHITKLRLGSFVDWKKL